MSADRGPLSDAERGQTMGRGARWVVRAVVVAVIVAGLGATVAVANGVPARVSAFVGGIVDGVTGQADPDAVGRPTVGPSVAAAPASSMPDAAASAVPAAAGDAPGVAGGGSGATVGATESGGETSGTGDAGTGLLDPRVDGAAFEAAVAEARAAADPEATSPDASELAARARALEVTRGLSTEPGEQGLDASAVLQSRIVANHDARWSALARTGSVADRPDTVDYLAPGTGATLDDLIARGSATRVDDRTVLVTKSVFVARGAVLDLTAPGQSIRVQSGAHGFATIVSWGGSITLAGTEDSPVSLSSWDPAAQAPDTDVADGRSYLRVHEGALALSWATTSDLGFWSGRTGGIALTGTETVPSRASISHTVITGQHLGLYLAFTRGASVEDSVVRSSTEQGIELANGSEDVTISGSTVTGSGADGISVRKGVDDVAVSGSTITRNGDYGIRVDGRAQAAAANSSGFSVEGGWGLTLDGSTVGDNRAGGAWVRGTGGVAIEGNTVDQRTVGLRLTDAQGSVSGNEVHVQPGSGIVLEGAATAVTVSGNTVTGEGPAAIDVAEGAARVSSASNTVDGWAERWEALVWVEAHPLALLWGLLLVIPVVGVGFVFYRMRRQRAIRELVEASTIALAAAAKSRWEAARAEAADGATASAVGADAVEDGRVVGAAGAGPHSGADGLVGAGVGAETLAGANGHAGVGAGTDTFAGADGPVGVGAGAVPLARAGSEVADGGGRTRLLAGAARGTGHRGGRADRGDRSDRSDRADRGDRGGRDVTVMPRYAPTGASRVIPTESSTSRAVSAGAASGSDATAAARTASSTGPAAGRGAPGAGAAVPGASASGRGAPRPDASWRSAGRSAVSAGAVGGASGIGQFSSVEELAVAAVLDAGKPIDRVAHALHVPIGSVAGWVAKARRARGEL